MQPIENQVPCLIAQKGEDKMMKKSSTRLLALTLSLAMLLSVQSLAFAAQPASEAGSNMGDGGISAASEEGSDAVTFIDADEASGETAFIDDADEASDEAAFIGAEAEGAESGDEITEDEAVTVSDADEGTGAAAELEPLGASGDYGNASYSYNEKNHELTVTFTRGTQNETEDGTEGESEYEEAPWKELPFTKLTVKVNAKDISACRIPEGAFSGCDSLQTVALPAALREIGMEAFSDCTALTSITIPDNVEGIGWYAFSGCTSLDSVVLPKNFKQLSGDEVVPFGTETELSKVEEVANLFDTCPLKTIRISGNPYFTVSGNALYATPASNALKVKALILYPNGSENESYRIPDDVEFISLYAFEGAPKLKHLALGKGCGNISNDLVNNRYADPFYNEGLESFSVNQANTNYSAPGGVLYDKEKTTLIKWPAKKEAASYHTPATCKKVAQMAFCGSGLEEIGLTEGVTEIGTAAFLECLSLKKLTLPASLTKVDSEAFGYREMSVDDSFSLTPSLLTDIYYTGTEVQWKDIEGMADALAVYGDKQPEIHFEAEAASPSADAEAEYDGTGAQEDEDAAGLNTQYIEGSLKDGSSLTLQFNYTGSTTYDGRKHVLSVNPAKKNAAVAPTASQNPDIEVKNFRVSLNGTVIAGITLKSCSYKNNTNPGTMQLIPAVNYDSKDADLKKLLKDHTDLKTVLGKMLNPKYDKKNEEWEYAPVFIEIAQIVLSEDTEVYNLKGKTSAEKKAIAAKDGVLVWNGDGEKISWTTRKVKEEADWNDDGNVTKWITYTYYIPTKVTVPGLYYQRVFDLGKGKTAVKKISLRAGGWSIKKKTYSEDGEKWTESWAAASSGTYDYLFEKPDVEGGYLKDKEFDERPTYIQPVLNAEGQIETRTRVVTYKEDGETWKEEEVYEVQVAKPGFFTGTLPSFDISG